MQGRVCVITGATSGIGRATAEELGRRDATLALVCRDRARGEETREAILTAGNAVVTLHLADLSSQAEIRRVAAELTEQYPQIHLLINNAGVANLHRTTTVDGIETVFAVNHLAYFLLTNLLLDTLRRSAPARIVNVASDAHKFGPLDFDDLQNTQRYRSLRVYGQSKLCNMLFTRELARRLAGTDVTVNAVHPGAVATRLGTNNGRWARLLIKGL
jgi:NAD(P)-dependent dehydrogenase (short-subunit alcohol dehydrogenase family)